MKFVLWIAAVVAAAQSTFEVASVKPIEQAEYSKTTYGPANLYGYGVTAKQLIEWAYDVTSMQVAGGPSWISEKNFEIDAKAEGTYTYPELKRMLQPLLTERFHLAVHKESREQNVFVLSVSKSGVKAQSAQGGRPQGILIQPVEGSKLQIVGQSVSMRYLTSYLTGTLASLVEDETGVTTSYDFSIDVAFDPSLGKQEAVAAALRDALPQLGFDLHARKRMVEMVVIDRISELTPN